MILDYFKFQQYVYSIIINMDWLWTDSLYNETNMLVEENILGKDHERKQTHFYQVDEMEH